MTEPHEQPGEQSHTGPLVVLIGAMGAGKTTVAEILAGALEVAHRDTDHDVERAEGRSVSDIFADESEQYFREQESAAVRRALAEHTGVLSLGGGAVLDPGTRELLAGQTVVWLRVGLAEAVKRVGLGTSRPMLLGNMRARIKALLDERAPVYASVATHTIDTDQRSVHDVAGDVRSIL